LTETPGLDVDLVLVLGIGALALDAVELDEEVDRCHRRDPTTPPPGPPRPPGYLRWRRAHDERRVDRRPNRHRRECHADASPRSQQPPGEDDRHGGQRKTKRVHSL